MTTKRSSSIVYTIRYGPCRTLYNSSWSESFAVPGGRGSSASPRIRLTTAWRSFLRGSTSSSWAAASVIRISYPSTALQVLDDIVEAQQRPSTSLLENLQVFRAITHGSPTGFVDRI